MSAPQPPRTETRHYRFDGEYTADATNMASSGWRVTDLRRLSDNTIMATYTYGSAPATAPLNPLSGPIAPPGAPTVPSFTAPPPHPPAQRPIRPIWPFSSTADATVARRNNRIILGVIAGLVILCCVVGAINGSISSAADASATATVAAPANATATASAVSAEATQVVMSATETVFYATATANALQHPPTPIPTSPVPTSPPPPVTVSGALLGGPLTDFEATYGAESSQYTWDTTIYGQQAQLVVHTTQSSESIDGQDRVKLIDIYGLSGSAWSVTEGAAIVAFFLPTDATQVGTGAGYGSLGPDHVYMSQQLANSLDASIFQASNGQRLTAGTFDWQCTTASTSPPFCEIGPGANS